MGQSCSTVQEHDNRNNFIQQNQMESIESHIQSQLRHHLENQKNKIKKITFIESVGQIIYQFKDLDQTVQKLKVQNWDKRDRFQSLEIQQFCNSISFIVKTKRFNDDKYVWKIFSTIKINDFSNRSMLDFGIFYLNFNKFKQIPHMRSHFIHIDRCSLKANQSQNQQACFIMQSQGFQQPIVSLKKLGQYMRQNDICWQDGQFVHIIKKSCQLIHDMHENNLFLFEDFLIDQNGQIYCIGGLIESSENIWIKKSQDFRLLSIYLIETLYGEQFGKNSIDLPKIVDSFQTKSKFKHPQTIQILLKMYSQQSLTNFNLKVDLKHQKSTNILHYVTSYRIKTSLQSSVILSDRYFELGQYWKAKQILFERLSILIYQQKGSVTKQNFKYENLKRLMSKRNIQKCDLQSVFQVFQKLISLEKIILKHSGSENELDGFIKEYISLAIMFSSKERKKQNYMKSLSIIQASKQFLGQENQSWLLNLHLAQSYFLTGNIGEAEHYFQKSIQLEINEANFCFYTIFFSSVLNWEKASKLMLQNESLIIEDYVYDFLIAKTLLSKALCASSSPKLKEDNKSDFFYESIRTAKRVLDRKSVSQVILCESYQVVGDGYFYIKQYQMAMQFYSKGLAIWSSIDFVRRKTLNQNEEQKYEPTYLKSNSLDYSRSLSLHQYGNSSLKKASTLKHSVNRSTEFDSLISSNQSKQTSFIHQLNLLLDFNKRAVLLTSTANCLFMLKKYTQAINFYEEARNLVLSQNNDLKNSIIGNMALCFIELSKKDPSKVNQTKLKEGKNLLQHIINLTKEENPSKFQNDVNYIFLLNQFQSL